VERSWRTPFEPVPPGGSPGPARERTAVHSALPGGSTWNLGQQAPPCSTWNGRALAAAGARGGRRSRRRVPRPGSPRGTGERAKIGVVPVRKAGFPTDPRHRRRAEVLAPDERPVSPSTTSGPSAPTIRPRRSPGLPRHARWTRRAAAFDGRTARHHRWGVRIPVTRRRQARVRALGYGLGRRDARSPQVRCSPRLARWTAVAPVGTGDGPPTPAGTRRLPASGPRIPARATPSPVRSRATPPSPRRPGAPGLARRSHRARGESRPRGRRPNRGRLDVERPVRRRPAPLPLRQAPGGRHLRRRPRSPPGRPLTIDGCWSNVRSLQAHITPHGGATGGLRTPESGQLSAFVQVRGGSLPASRSRRDRWGGPPEDLSPGRRRGGSVAPTPDRHRSSSSITRRGSTWAARHRRHPQRGRHRSPPARWPPGPDRGGADPDTLAGVSGRPRRRSRTTSVLVPTWSHPRRPLGPADPGARSPPGGGSRASTSELRRSTGVPLRPRQREPGRLHRLRDGRPRGGARIRSRREVQPRSGRRRW
jgi:hypothetical protein